MGTLAKTLLIASTLGIGYVILRSRQASAATSRRPTPESETAEPAPDYTARGDGPKAPLTEPTHPNLNQRLTRSSQSETVIETPADLLVQARRYDGAITLDELTGARLAKSEHGSGSFTELACIVDTELNRAVRKKMSLFASLTHRGTFGSQGPTRPASTRQDPHMRHLLAARAVLSGQARGIARGAVMFFDPATMDRQNREYLAWLRGGRQGKKPSIVSCDALTLLETWCFDFGSDRESGNRCPPDRSRSGKRTLAWIGDIPGVDATRLMLMTPMPLGDEHTRRYQAARDLLRRKLGR